MQAVAAQTRNLTKYYPGFCALDQVSIQVGRGEIFGLIGDNGAGKTTLLKALAGQIFPSEGEMALFGEWENLDPMRKRMGTLIEEPGFYPQLSVEKNLEYYRIQRGVPGKGETEEILEIIGLQDARKKKASSLSLGMKQRLGLGIALMGTPELLVLDEPINGLDPSGIVEMRKLLERLNREKKITILITSHILSELEQIATVYCFLKKGKLLEQISAGELEKKCADYVEIRVSDPERYTVLLEQKIGHRAYQVMPDGRIYVKTPGLETEAYSHLASQGGLEVRELTRYHQSLEEYYLNLKKGGDQK